MCATYARKNLLAELDDSSLLNINTETTEEQHGM